METWIPPVIGMLYATAFYLMMRRSIVKMILGLILLSHGTNLLIFISGGLTPGGVPIVGPGQKVHTGPLPDPLAQAMILTAIVISFAVLAFVLVLTYRSYESIGTDDVDDLKMTDP